MVKIWLLSKSVTTVKTSKIWSENCQNADFVEFFFIISGNMKAHYAIVLTAIDLKLVNILSITIY